jgi:hypothetical protein
MVFPRARIHKLLVSQYCQGFLHGGVAIVATCLGATFIKEYKQLKFQASASSTHANGGIGVGPIVSNAEKKINE